MELKTIRRYTALMLAPYLAVFVFFAMIERGVTATGDRGSTINVTREQVCQPGYAKAARPPYIYTWIVKRLMTIHPKWYELDHIVPIELGGAPYALSNLQLQTWDDAKRKDAMENLYHDFVCNWGLSLEKAQAHFKGQ